MIWRRRLAGAGTGRNRKKRARVNHRACSRVTVAFGARRRRGPPAAPCPIAIASGRLARYLARMTWSVNCALVLVAASALAAAAPPAFEGLFPAGAPRGESLTVMAIGNPGTNAFRLWSDDPNLVFTAGKTNGQFQLALGTNATVGPHWVRAFDDHGVSTPHLFVVGETPELVFFEPPPAAGATSVIEQLPTTLNVLLRHPQETNAFTLRLAHDQFLEARFQALALDSLVEATLALINPAGLQLTATDASTNADPVLTCLLAKDGLYRLRVTAHCPADDTGTNAAAGAFYRLVLAAGAPPPAPATNSDAMDSKIVRPALSEPWLAFPATVHGILNPPGNEDVYPFNAMAGDRFTFSVQAGSLGSPLSALLLVRDADRREVARAEAAPDPLLNWAAPADGRYAVIVTDAQRRGGMAYRYIVDFLPPQGAFSATVPDHTFTVAPGSQVRVPVQVTRSPQCQGVLSVVLGGLPEDVSAAPLHSTPELKELAFTATASPAAKPGGGPFRIVLFTTDQTPPLSATATAPVKGKHAPAGGLLLNTIDQFWLNVESKPNP